MSFDHLPFADLDVKLSEHMVEAHYVDRVRSWRERLLSWPWRPWLRLEQVRSVRPSSRAVMIDERTVVMHPATYETLKAVARLQRDATERIYVPEWEMRRLEVESPSPARDAHLRPPSGSAFFTNIL